MLANLKISVNAVLPLFVIMAAGYAVKRAGLLRDKDVPRLNALAFQVFLPCLLFYNIYVSDLSESVRPKLILFVVCGVFAVYLSALILVLAIEKEPEKRGVMIQGLYRSNYVVVGIPIAAALSGGGSLGVVTLLIAILVPIFNVLAVVTLAGFCGRRVNVGGTLADILKNPLIISTALGLLIKWMGLTIPGFLFAAVKDMGAASTPLQLLILGAFFQIPGMKEHRKSLVVTVFGRLVVVPGLMLSAAAALGFRGVEFVALIGCFASPTATSSFVMTQQMGGDAGLAGDIVVLTSALCPFTIFGWAFLFKALGIY